MNWFIAFLNADSGQCHEHMALSSGATTAHKLGPNMVCMGGQTYEGPGANPWLKGFAPVAEHFVDYWGNLNDKISIHMKYCKQYFSMHLLD